MKAKKIKDLFILINFKLFNSLNAEDFKNYFN